MKEIKAYIRDNMVDQVVDALEAIPEVPGVAVSRITGFGHTHAGDDATVRVEMSKLEVDVPDDQVATVVDCIVRNSRTRAGHPGDGKVFVSGLEEAVRIADGARGESILRRER